MKTLPTEGLTNSMARVRFRDIEVVWQKKAACCIPTCEGPANSAGHWFCERMLGSGFYL